MSSSSVSAGPDRSWPMNSPRTGLDVVAIERGPWRDTATDFNIGTAPDELRYARASRHVPASEAGNADHAQQPLADGAADPQMGQLPARQWRRRRRRALERPDLALPARRFPHPQPHDRALRRGRSCPRAITSRIGRSATTSSSRITTSSSMSPASPARPATSRGRSSRAAIPSRARASANIRRRR